MSDREGTKSIAFCPLLSKLTWSFHFQGISIKFFWQKGSCNLNVVWMSKIRCVSKNNFQTSDYPPKGVQENMLKAWNFTKNKLLHKCFVNNLQKKFRANILENGTAQMFLIVLLMFGLLLDNQLTQTSNWYSWLKWFHLYLLPGRYLRLKFKKCFIHLQKHILDPVKHLRWTFLR